jgi:F420-0:gamma-glutamyl ligase-like protein
VVAFKTRYWRPGTDYREQIVKVVRNHVKDGDIIAVSEKALATATGNIIDESRVKASLLSKFLVDIWVKKIWGGPLGRITRLKSKTMKNLREYPSQEGAIHKQVTLNRVGFLQSLRHYSEGGIDASNLPYSYVSLPLDDL